MTERNLQRFDDPARILNFLLRYIKIRMKSGVKRNYRFERAFWLYKIFIIPIASIASESQLRLYNYFFFTIKNALKGINFRSCRKRSC